MIHGETGCGKTGLLSRVIQQCGSWQPEAFIIFRFVGVTPESSSLVQILRTVVSQLIFLLKGRNYWIPHVCVLHSTSHVIRLIMFKKSSYNLIITKPFSFVFHFFCRMFTGTRRSYISLSHPLQILRLVLF